MMLYIKKYWWIFLSVLAFVLGALLFWRRGGSRRVTVPDRPELDDVKKPDVPKVDVKVFERYAERAREIDKEIAKRKDDKRISDANERYK